MSTHAKPLRIALISYYLPSGSKIGVGYQVHELASALVRRGHMVDVFSDCPPVSGAIYGHQQIPMTGHLRTFRFALAVGRQDFSAYDVVHGHTDDYWVRTRGGTRHVRTLHGSCFEEALHIRGFRERLRMLLLGVSEVVASLTADETVVVSPRTRRWTPWVRKVVPNGVDDRRFHSIAEERSGSPVVLFVGTWGNRKRGHVLAQQFQDYVLPQFPDARLEMVCRDAPGNPGPGVELLGELTDDEIAAAYRRAWVFCLPSSYEGFGIPYVEAMLSGTPVVATPNVGARYVLGEGNFGRLVSVDELGTTIANLLRDANERTRLSDAGRTAGAAFAMDHVVSAYEAIYRSHSN